MSMEAQQAVKGPAIGLIATSGIGLLFQVGSLLLNVLGTGMGAMAGGGEDAAIGMLSGGIGIVSNIVGIAIGGFIIWAALQMMKLEKFNLSMAASIVIILPFLSPCCCIGIGTGIWSLVVLNKAEVKGAFTS